MLKFKMTTLRIIRVPLTVLSQHNMTRVVELKPLGSKNLFKPCPLNHRLSRSLSDNREVTLAFNMGGNVLQRYCL